MRKPGLVARVAAAPAVRRPEPVRRRAWPSPGLLLLLPALLLLCALTLYPVGYGVWLSLFDKHALFPQTRFVGLANYAYLLRDDPVLGGVGERHGLRRARP